MRRSLTKQERLKGRSDLKRIFTSPKHVSHAGIKLKFYPNGLQRNRIAVSLSRKFGTAVVRNRAKRVAREAYRLLKPSLKTGYDLAFVLYPGDNDFTSCKERFEILFRKVGMLESRESTVEKQWTNEPF